MPVACPSFKIAFQINMATLNLPAPDSLFSTYTTAMTNLSAMLGALSKLGADATVAEMIGATTGLEALAAIAGIGAAAYTGRSHRESDRRRQRFDGLHEQRTDIVSHNAVGCPQPHTNSREDAGILAAQSRGHHGSTVPVKLRVTPSSSLVRETGGTRMNRILDRIALILTAIACALGAWAFYRYTEQWSGPIIMTVVIIGLFMENHRLRKLLAAHGIESRPRRSRNT